MPILFFQQGEKLMKSHTFLGDIHIGSDPQNDLVLPVESGVASSHAAIIHSALNRQHLLVNLADGCATLVNGQPVISIKVLYQQDEISLGQVRFTLWEICITRLTPDHPLVGKRCLICRERTLIDEELIICPRCSTPHHRNCGFSVSVCANYTCEYPIRKSVMDALAGHVKLEYSLSEDSELVEVLKDGKRIKSGVCCPAGNIGDEVAFQVRDVEPVAFCPGCNKPFHLPCWLLLENCPVCNFDVRALIDEVFLVNYDGVSEYSIPGTGAAYARQR